MVRRYRDASRRLISRTAVTASFLTSSQAGSVCKSSTFHTRVWRGEEDAVDVTSSTQNSTALYINRNFVLIRGLLPPPAEKLKCLWRNSLLPLFPIQPRQHNVEDKIKKQHSMAPPSRQRTGSSKPPKLRWSLSLHWRHSTSGTVPYENRCDCHMA